MNVFVTGTGRCGTMTFSKACGHITNFSSGHETKAGKPLSGRLDYRPQHIEVDPHLTWIIGPIIARYPDAFFVHLQRDRDAVVESWRRRGIRPNRGAAPLVNTMFQCDCQNLTTREYTAALELLYDGINSNLALALANTNSMHIWLHDAKARLPEFWERIGAEADLGAAIREFDRHYNAS